MRHAAFPSQRGTARSGQTLVVALVVLALVTGLLGTMSLALMAEARFAAYRGRHLAAFYAARAGVETACLQILADDPAVDGLTDAWHTSKDKEGRIGGYVFQVAYRSETTGRPRLGVADEERKLNVNRADRATLRALDPRMSDATAKAILRARPFVTLADLCRVPGITRAYLEAPLEDAPGGLASLLTVYGDGRVNINTAPLAVLRSLEALTPADARRLIAHRDGPDGKPGTDDDRRFRDLSEVRTLLGIQEASFERLRPWLTVASRHFTLTCRGAPATKPLPACTVRQVVRRDRDGLTVVRFEEVNASPGAATFPRRRNRP